MLDASLLDALRGHFAGLKSEMTLALRRSSHSSQKELEELLQELASTNGRIKVHQGDVPSEVPCFDLLRDGSPTGVRFRGVPGGHEFTSLVLAILNADGLGRLPDASLLGRVAALRGPVHLRTFVSLECTNCPDVVQALNLMALQHPDFTHEFIDGGLVPDEVTRLGIQGVPAVFEGDRLLHVGKSDFGSLLELLEGTYGHSESTLEKPGQEFDVVVLGGGPAGASAAIYSARKGLKTALVAQKLGGQVNETLGIENLISVSRTQGPKLAADLTGHVRDYPVEIFEHRRIEAVRDGVRKEVRLQGGEVLLAKALIVATGAKWRELGVPGEKEHIGRGVAFCPHCDGPFFAGKRVAVVGGGNSGVEAALDLANLCSEVTLLEFADQLKADRVLVEKLHAHPNVRVLLSARTVEVVGDGTAVQALAYEDRSTKEIRRIELDGVFVQIGLVPNSAFVKDVVETNRMGEILIDSHCRTNVPGIYAAGDVSSVPYKQIVIAMGEGAKAALSAFEDSLRQAG
ncbi:MAG: alkyl hydroperoxide reductase subunit [Fibrobacterota bacterium]